MSTFTEVVEAIGLVIDGLGVLAIVLGLLLPTLWFAAASRREPNSFHRYRQNLGRGILLGLEFLVAADIIRTVAVTPTLQGVLILGLIVLVRTFLSISLQVEVEGRWRWQQVEALPQGTAQAAEVSRRSATEGAGGPENPGGKGPS
jgi:uncharacterized membrane protein